MTTVEIKVNPDPPQAGKKLNIKYTGTLPATLNVQVNPPTGSRSTVTITTAAGTDIDVPANATEIVISDPTGVAPSRDLPVMP